MKMEEKLQFQTYRGDAFRRTLSNIVIFISKRDKNLALEIMPMVNRGEDEIEHYRKEMSK